MRQFSKLLILVLVAAAGYYGVTQFVQVANSQSTNLLTSDTTSQPTGDAAIIISNLNRLQGIDLDTSFFKDSSYKSLQDFNVEVTQQPIGRSNPFLPAGGSVGQQSQAASKVNSQLPRKN